MRTIKQWIRNVFGFSAREINGFLVLIPLMFMIIMSKPVYHWWVAYRPVDFSHEQKQLDSLVQLWTRERTASVKADTVQITYFNFDPNHASVDDLIRLGFSRHLSTRIATYREKGGKFKVKKDLLKIYGLDSALYLRVKDHVLLPETFKKEEAFLNENNWKATRRESQPPIKQSDRKKQPFNAFDLNRADTTELKSVYGIGSRLAMRILRFRESLGGFIHKDQLFEIYGIDSMAVVQLQNTSFIDSNFTPQKIDLNSATEEQLAKHPYIRKSIAKAIVTYRFQHGSFGNIGEVANIAIVKATDLQRMTPYIVVNGSDGF